MGAITRKANDTPLKMTRLSSVEADVYHKAPQKDVYSGVPQI